MNRLLALAVAAVVVLTLAPSARAGVNVVPNPGFEQGGCGTTPVICGWQANGLMSRNVSSSGDASMSLSCWPTGCWPAGGWASVSASTDATVCAAIGPGTHPASVDFSGTWGWASLGAAFFQGVDCTGAFSYDSFGDWTAGGRLTGNLVAPPGTQSALFELALGAQCDDFCWLEGSFDNVDVEDAVVSDTTPPQTTITSAQAGGASTWATFEFAASEPSTFECSLDDAPFGACASPASYADLADGSHTFRVRATDRAGNTDATPAEETWTVAIVGDFSITANPNNLSVMQGEGKATTIQTTVTSGAAQVVWLAAAVQPAGAGIAASFSPSTITTGDRSMMAVNVGVATPPGTYMITVTGFGESWTHTTTVSLTVTCCGSDFAIAANPSTLTVAQGSSGTSTIQTTLTSGSPQTVLLSAVATPAVVTSVGFAPGSVTMGGSSAMTVTVAAAAPPGTYTMTVRGTTTSGSAMHDAPIELVVQPAPANAPPTAAFTVSCSGLTCSLDAGASVDPDGSIAAYAWNFGDGANATGKTVSHTYAGGGSYTVTLTVTDDAGATATVSKAANPIGLSARGYKVSGSQKVDLLWSGPSGTSYDVYRNGARIATVQAGSYTDNIDKKGSATYTYKVCAPAAGSCSNEARVSF